MNAEAQRTIGGRYVLHDELAAGGMATVHLGRIVGAAGFSRTVAIKRLHPQFAKDPDFVSMFIDEARIAARIRHPNVVATLDTVSVDGELFLVMEYVLGDSLSRLARPATADAGSRVPVEVAAGVMIGVLHGLHAAHEATDERGVALEVVHRDVSPQNILVGVDGIARVLDFGVAKALGRLQTTHDGQVKGKVAYMAPEQLRGGKVDRRTDVYAASVVLWEILTGRRLFVSSTPGETMARVLEQNVEPPSRYAKDVPPALDDVVTRGLQREPGKRFATADEMALALEGAVPHPSPRVIARWVRDVGGTRIERQSQIIARIDGDARNASTPQPSVPSREEPPSQVVTSVATEIDPPRRPPVPWRWIAGGGVAIVSIVAVVSARSCLQTKSPSTNAEQPAANATATSSALTIASSSAMVTAAPSIATSLAASTTAPSTPPSASAPNPTPKKPPVVSTVKKKNCNPPYTIDAVGVHIPKKECR